MVGERKPVAVVVATGRRPKGEITKIRTKGGAARKIVTTRERGRGKERGGESKKKKQ